jgi:hypothetical protein
MHGRGVERAAEGTRRVAGITVLNTGGYQEYVIHYNVTTANSKLIKVEEANLSPRSLSIDGINVYCLRPKVVCGDDLNQPSDCTGS